MTSSIQPYFLKSEDFDPLDNVPYARVDDRDFDTKEEFSAFAREMYDKGMYYSAVISNPTRKERIKNHILDFLPKDKDKVHNLEIIQNALIHAAVDISYEPYTKEEAIPVFRNWCAYIDNDAVTEFVEDFITKHL